MLKKGKLINRAMAFVMTVVMVLTLVTIDNRFGTTATSDATEIDLSEITFGSVSSTGKTIDIALEDATTIYVNTEGDITFTGSDYYLCSVEAGDTEAVTAYLATATDATGVVSATDIEDASVLSDGDTLYYLVYTEDSASLSSESSAQLFGSSYKLAGLLAVLYRDAGTMTVTEPSDLKKITIDDVSYPYVDFSSTTSLTYTIETEEVDFIECEHDGATTTLTEDDMESLVITEAGTYVLTAYQGDDENSEECATETITVLSPGTISVSNVSVSSASSSTVLTSTTDDVISKISSADSVKVSVTAVEAINGLSDTYAPLSLCYTFVNSESSENTGTCTVFMIENGDGTYTASITVPDSIIDGASTYTLVMWVQDSNMYTISSYVFSADGAIVFINTEKPTVSLEADETSWTNTINITGTANDANSNLESVAFYTDSANIATYSCSDTSEYSATITESALDEGSYTIYFSATNELGTTSDEASVDIKLDTTAPTLTVKNSSGTAIASGETYNTNGETATVTFKDALSGLSSTSIKVMKSGTDVTSSVVAANGTDNSYNLTLTTTGTYVMSLAATDVAGNEVTGTYTFVVVADTDGVTGTMSLTKDGSNINISGKTLVYTNGSEVVLTYVATGYQLTTSDVTATVSPSLTPSVTTVTGTTANTITYTYTLTENKDYTFEFVVNDHNGLSDSVTDSLEVIYDTEAPGVETLTFNNYTKRLGGVYYYSESATPTVTIKTTDNFALDSFVIKDSDGNTLISSSLTTYRTSYERTLSLASKLEANELYTITFYIKDKAGNTKTTASYKIAIDTKKPSLSLNDVDSYTNSTVKVKASVTDNFNVVSMKAEATLDGESIDDQEADITAGESATATFKYTKAGTYKVVVYAYDEVGNYTKKTVTFVIDKTNPVATVEDMPESHITDDADITIVITDNEKIDKSMFTVTQYSRKYNEVTYTSKILKLTQEDEYTVSVTISCSSIDGMPAAYYFTVEGADKAGNEVEYNVADSRIRIDDETPEIEILNDPEEINDGYYNTTVTTRFTVTEQFTNTTTVVVSDNQGNKDTYKQNALTQKYSVIRRDEGKYKVTIKATDAAGNYETETFSFVIDKTAPTVSIASVNAINSTSVNVNVTLTDNFMGDTYTVHVKRTSSTGATVYDADYKTGTWASTTERLALAFTDEGDYEVSVYATDKAGNTSTTQSVSFRIDKTAPVLSITGVEDTQTKDCTATLSVNEAFAFNYEGATGSVNVTATITKKVDGTVASTVATLSTSDFSSSNPHTASYSFTEDGEYTITLSATDVAGNVATAVTKTFVVDKTAPQLSVTAVDMNSSAVTDYQVIGADTDEGNYVDMRIEVIETFYTSNKVDIAITKDGANVSSDYFTSFKSSSTTSTATQRFTEDGVYNVTVTAKDALGNAADDYNIVFTIDNTAPSVEATSLLTSFLGSANEDGDILLNASAFADILGSGYEALWNVNDTSIFVVDTTLDGVSFVDFSDLTDGYHTMVITVTDEVGHVTVDEFSFTYDGTAPRIIITGVADGDTVYEGFTMNISLEDDDDYITKIIINGETIDSSLYEATNSYDYVVTDFGTYEVMVYASDTAGNISSTYDSETGEIFTFKYVDKSTITMYVIIGGLVFILLLLLILLLVMKRRKKKDDK